MLVQILISLISLTAFSEDHICEDTYQTIIIVEDDLLFYIPNAFTPDGSGVNDKFSPIFYSGVDVYDFKLEILNRWGETVFVSYNPAIGWDGSYNNSTVAQGVYVWMVSFNETMTDKNHTQIGNVTVIR